MEGMHADTFKVNKDIKERDPQQQGISEEGLYQETNLWVQKGHGISYRHLS